jgi:hypothetical protein
MLRKKLQWEAAQTCEQDFTYPAVADKRQSDAKPSSHGKPSPQSSASIRTQLSHIACCQVPMHDPRGKCGLAHTRIQAASRQRRNRARSITDEQPTRIHDVWQDAANWNPTTTLFDEPTLIQRHEGLGFPAEFGQRIVRRESTCVAPNSHMNLAAIMCDPGDIPRRQLRIDETVQARRAKQWNVLVNLLHSDNPLVVLVQAKLPRDARVCAISSHDKASQE